MLCSMFFNGRLTAYSSQQNIAFVFEPALLWENTTLAIHYIHS